MRFNGLEGGGREMIKRLQIDIFRGQPKYIFFGINAVEDKLIVNNEIDKWLKELEEISFWFNYHIQGIVFFDNNELSDENNRVNLFLFDLQRKIKSSFQCGSMEKVMEEIRNYCIALKKLPSVINCVRIEECPNVILSKMVLLKICSITQQFFLYNTVQLITDLTLNVRTMKGVKQLFLNGKSQQVIFPILSVENFENIDKCLENEKIELFFGEELINYSSSLCFHTGEYAFSFEIFNMDRTMRSYIHVRSSIQSFWSSIKTIEIAGETHLVITNLRIEDNARNTFII